MVKWVRVKNAEPGQLPTDYFIPGRCAVCRCETAVKFCPNCKAVICALCRHRYFKRGLAAVKALMSGGYRGEILVEV